MFEFKITDIPEGESHLSFDFDSKHLDLELYPLKKGSINLEFRKNEHYIKVNFSVESVIELICDRSLDAFDQNIISSYSVTFNAEAEDERIDEDQAIRNIDFITNSVNIEQDIRDTILLNIPIKKIHPRFLDETGNPKDFISEAFGKSENDEDAIDPRWEALKKLKK